MSKTLEEIKEEVAKEYTSGKSGWYGNYLSERIKLLLMNEVAKLYAQSQTQELQEQNAELVANIQLLLQSLDYDALGVMSELIIEDLKELLTKYNHLTQKALTVKDKAIEVIKKFRAELLFETFPDSLDTLSKECAIIHVKGIISDCWRKNSEREKYWKEVLTELNQM